MLRHFSSNNSHNCLCVVAANYVGLSLLSVVVFVVSGLVSERVVDGNFCWGVGSSALAKLGILENQCA